MYIIYIYVYMYIIVYFIIYYVLRYSGILCIYMLNEYMILSIYTCMPHHAPNAKDQQGAPGPETDEELMKSMALREGFGNETWLEKGSVLLVGKSMKILYEWHSQ